MNKKWILMLVSFIFAWIILFTINRYVVDWNHLKYKTVLEKNYDDGEWSISIAYKKSKFSINKMDVKIKIKKQNTAFSFVTKIKGKSSEITEDNYKIEFFGDYIRLELIDDGCKVGRTYYFYSDDFQDCEL